MESGYPSLWASLRQNYPIETTDMRISLFVWLTIWSFEKIKPPNSTQPSCYFLVWMCNAIRQLEELSRIAYLRLVSAHAHGPNLLAPLRLNSSFGLRREIRGTVWHEASPHPLTMKMGLYSVCAIRYETRPILQQKLEKQFIFKTDRRTPVSQALIFSYRRIV